MVKISAVSMVLTTLLVNVSVQAQQVAAPAQSSASAPVASAKPGNGKAVHMRQMQSACRAKVADSGVPAEARKKAMFDCMRGQ